MLTTDKALFPFQFHSVWSSFLIPRHPRGHNLLPPQHNPLRSSPLTHHHPAQQLPLQLQRYQPCLPWPPSTLPTLPRQSPPTTRPRLYPHDPLLHLQNQKNPTHPILDTQHPRRIRPLRNCPPLHLPPPGTALPNSLRAITPQLSSRGRPLRSSTTRRVLGGVQRLHGRAHGYLPPRRRHPNPTIHPGYRGRPLPNQPARYARYRLLVENLLPPSLAPGRLNHPQHSNKGLNGCLGRNPPPRTRHNPPFLSSQHQKQSRSLHGSSKISYLPRPVHHHYHLYHSRK